MPKCERSSLQRLRLLAKAYDDREELPLRAVAQWKEFTSFLGSRDDPTTVLKAFSIKISRTDQQLAVDWSVAVLRKLYRHAQRPFYSF